MRAIRDTQVDFGELFESELWLTLREMAELYRGGVVPPTFQEGLADIEAKILGWEGPELTREEYQFHGRLCQVICLVDDMEAMACSLGDSQEDRNDKHAR